MKFLILTFIAVLVIIIGGGVIITKSNTTSNTLPKTSITPSQSVNTSAKFAIFTNGTFRIFTDKRYHNKNSDVYIDSGKTNTVLVKKSGITWQDFFNTLPMKLEKDCLTTGTGQIFCTKGEQRLKFYINGEEDPNALDKEIKQDDILLVSYGNEGEEGIKAQQLETFSL